MKRDDPAERTAWALRLLDETQSLLQVIFLGLSLQYKALDFQRRQLLQEADGVPWRGADPAAMQTAASLITLCALLGFQRQSEQLACQSAQAGTPPDMTDVSLNTASVLISLIRLARLQNPSSSEAARLDDSLTDAVP